MKFKDIISDVLKIINVVSDEKKKKENAKDEKVANGKNGSADLEKEEIYKKLDKIDEDYNSNEDRTYGTTLVPSLKEKTYNPQSDDEIKSIAENEYFIENKAKKQKLTDDAETKKNAYLKEISDIENQEKEDENRVNSAYERAKENASNESIKRGIARSSIVSEQLKELDEAKISDIENLIKDKKQSVESVNEKISKLSDELSSALNDLDIETAVNINKRIAELKSEREKREDEVLEYNNAIKEKRAKTLSELIKQGVDVSEENSQEYINANSEKLRTLYDYYKLSGESALENIEADRARIEKYVGHDGYLYLKNLLNA